MKEQIKFQSVLITGQQSQGNRLQTQPASSPIDPIENLTYSNSNYFIQKNLPIADYEAQKQASYHQQTITINNQPFQEKQRITAKHSASQKYSINKAQAISIRKSKMNDDSDSGNEDGIFCGVRTETKPKSLQVDLAAEQANRSGSDYGICKIF